MIREFKKLGTGRKCFVIINGFIIMILALACLFPVLHVLAISFSSKSAIVSGAVGIWPSGFTLINYDYIVKDARFHRSFLVSLQREALAIPICLLLTLFAAYPLSYSKQKFHARQFYMWFFLVPMLFSGGMVPTYLVVSKTGLINSIWALVIPGAVTMYFVILMQNFIKDLPDSIRESAFIDGAGHFTMLFRIILPLCRPAVATIILFIAIGHWNDWFGGMLYITNNWNSPLQTYLRTISIKFDMTMITSAESIEMLVSDAGANTAKIFVAMVPILAVYPFIQRHFVTGIKLGSVKE